MTEKSGLKTQVKSSPRAKAELERHDALSTTGTCAHSHHFVSASQENRYGFSVLASFDHQHPVFGRTESQLAHDAGMAELLRRQFGESRNNSAARRNGDQLCFRR